VKRCPLTASRLAEAAAGERIVFLSDFHSRRVSFLEREVWDAVDRLRPSLILLGGDYVKAKAARKTIKEVYTPLGEIAPCLGVLGNNDYEYGHGLKALIKGLDRAGVRLLRNQSLLWPPSEPRFAVAGVEDAIEGTPDLEAACEKVPADIPCILLSHTPQIQDDPIPSCVRLILAGHTHGGQIRIPLLLPLFMLLKGYPLHRSGLSRGGERDLYVTRGIGTTGPSVRFRCPPEITLPG